MPTDFTKNDRRDAFMIGAAVGLFYRRLFVGQLVGEGPSPRRVNEEKKSGVINPFTTCAYNYCI